MYSYIKCNELIIQCNTRTKLKRLYIKYMRHEFDLLGSGFVKNGYNLNPKGVCGKRYVNPSMSKYGKKAAGKLHKKCSASYQPINWFVDFKSGFFFDPKEYNTREKCRSIIGKRRGVDIKCPWELGRFYHLVRLAIYAIAEKSCRDRIVVEFRDEVLDFIYLNPVGRTVQWSAPMDTSIRIVNLLIAYDILKQLDDKRKLDRQFERQFEQLIRGSLKYVLERLECSEKAHIGGNHYLSNIVGIIFASAYLPADDFTDTCCVFGAQELITQVERQFNPEGSHFEGSTSYHRLSAEFAVYATALLYGVLASRKGNIFRNYKHNLLRSYGLKPYGMQKYDIRTSEFFPQWYLNRLYNMGVFTRAILKQNNEIVQIGDNDNGRLVMLTPMGECLQENVLDHRTLLAEFSGLFDCHEWEDMIGGILLEKSMLQTLANHTKVNGQLYQTLITDFNIHQNRKIEYEYFREKVLYKSESETKLNEGVRIYWFQSFGIIILRGKRIFVSMVIDTAGSDRFCGHTHNDKLSIEVMVDEQYITRDPGTYIYTASPELMGRFRSVKAHNVIHVNGCEQNLLKDMWFVKRRSKSQLIYANSQMIVGEVCYDRVKHFREVIITEKEIIVKDYANQPFTVGFNNKIYASQYGKLARLRTGED